MPKKLHGYVCDNCRKFVDYSLVDNSNWVIITEENGSTTSYCSQDCLNKNETCSCDQYRLLLGYLPICSK